MSMTDCVTELLDSGDISNRVSALSCSFMFFVHIWESPGFELAKMATVRAPREG